MALPSCSCETTEAALQSHAPAGAVEPNEQPLEAAIREMAEEFEISLDPSNCIEIWRYSHEHAAIDHILVRHLLTRHPSCMKVLLGRG
jgi:8-oxo-dGTP pyrophosphatase MutT (NUDIX family)